MWFALYALQGKSRKRKAKEEWYYLTRFGEGVHVASDCPPLRGSTDVKKFQPCANCFLVIEKTKVQWA